MNRRELIKTLGSARLAYPLGLASFGGSALAQSPILIGFSQALMNHPHRVAMATINQKYWRAELQGFEVRHDRRQRPGAQARSPTSRAWWRRASPC